MNTPKLRWFVPLWEVSFYRPSAVVTRMERGDPMLQQQVSDDKGHVTWLDVPTFYEGEQE